MLSSVSLRQHHGGSSAQGLGVNEAPQGRTEQNISFAFLFCQEVGFKRTSVLFHPDHVPRSLDSHFALDLEAAQEEQRACVLEWIVQSLEPDAAGTEI